MKKRITYPILLFLLGLLQTCQYNDLQADSQVSIAYFPDGKLASLALTFDDNCPSSFTAIVPMLQEYGYKATFFIIPNQVRLNQWSKWRKLSEDGFEIGNHTLDHLNLATMRDSVKLHREINKSYEIITDKIGKAPFSFAHPFNATSKAAEMVILEKHYVSRMSPGLCSVWGVTSSSRASYFEEFLDGGIENSYFMAVAAHGIGDGWEPLTAGWLKHGLQMIKEREGKIAVESFGNLAKYKIEQQNTEVAVRQFYKKLSVTLQTSLDTAVFNYPLTVVIDNPKNRWGEITPLDGTKILDVIHRDGKILIKLLPLSKFEIRRN